MRFGVNQNLNKVKNKTKASHPLLRLSGGGDKGYKKGGLLGSSGNNENDTKKDDYSLPFFVEN